MNPRSVQRLAGHENGLRHPVNTVVERGPDGPPGSYSPLGHEPGAPAVATAVRIEFLDATAVGTVLVVRFRWPPDEQARDLLLPLDFRACPDDVDGAGTWLLEYVEQHVHHDQSWFPRDLVPISPTAAVVRPVRVPGGR